MNIAFRKDGYKGEYINDIANLLIEKYNDSLLNKSDDFFKDTAEEFIFSDIKKTLNKVGLKFDNYFNENELYENKKIYDVIDKLNDKKLIYKKDNKHGLKLQKLEWRWIEF